LWKRNDPCQLLQQQTPILRALFHDSLDEHVRIIKEIKFIILISVTVFNLCLATFTLIRVRVQWPLTVTRTSTHTYNSTAVKNGVMPLMSFRGLFQYRWFAVESVHNYYHQNCVILLLLCTCDKYYYMLIRTGCL